jgi:serine/threonine protein kinase
MPPEVVARKEYIPAKFDIFSAGVILFTLYTGFPPFNSAAEDDQFYKEIINGNIDKFWEDTVRERRKKSDFYSKDFQDLINSMLHPNPSERATLESI